MRSENDVLKFRVERETYIIDFTITPLSEHLLFSGKTSAATNVLNHIAFSSNRKQTLEWVLKKDYFQNFPVFLEKIAINIEKRRNLLIIRSNEMYRTTVILLILVEI